MPFAERDYYTVHEITTEIRELLEEDYAEIRVMGEVSNHKRAASGHVYFTLKDADAQLSVACFRREAERLDFELEDGLNVIATGRLSLFERTGRFQLIAYAMEPAGEGALERAFQLLKEKLEAEGLFAAEHKRLLPLYPFRIAVVTSPTGAAIRDIQSTLARRWPCAEIVLYPVRVQGELAVDEIVRALDDVSGRDDIDVVIAGRGGGSLEELWAFNEESVARAIHRCPIPVISAVGHETDFTIADFVADVRAATPTMAAEIAVPRLDEVSAQIDAARLRIANMGRSLFELRRGRLRELLRSYALGRVQNLIEHSMQRLDHAGAHLSRHMRDRLVAARSRSDTLAARLHGLDAKAILARGYAICSDHATGHVLKSVDAALAAGSVDIRFSDGGVRSQVREKLDGKETDVRRIDEAPGEDRGGARAR